LKLGSRAKAAAWVATVAPIACGGVSTPANGDPAVAEALDRVTAATAIVRAVRSDADGLIPIAIARAARCVAVVPHLVHAGVLVGARSGRGVMTCVESGAWTRPSFFMVNGATAGLAAGFERVDLVMLVMTDAGESALLSGKWQLGADTSIAAGPVGRSAEAATQVALGATVIYYSRASGLFAGVDLSGSVIEMDEEATRAFYGDARDFGTLLRSPRPPPPAGATFREEVARTFGPGGGG
jgi:lipid-binding SYLF domain-containing protein